MLQKSHEKESMGHSHLTFTSLWLVGTRNLLFFISPRVSLEEEIQGSAMHGIDPAIAGFAKLNPTPKNHFPQTITEADEVLVAVFLGLTLVFYVCYGGCTCKESAEQLMLLRLLRLIRLVRTFRMVKQANVTVPLKWIELRYTEMLL